MTSYFHRVQQLQNKLSANQAVLLTQIPNLLYFSGFRAVTTNEREGFLLITQKSATLFAAAFSPLPNYLSSSQQSFLTVQQTTNLARLSAVLLHSQVKEVFLEENGILVSEMKELQAALQEGQPTYTPQFQPLNPQWIWQLRTKKDETEIENMKKAGQIVHQALQETLSTLKLGQTERQIAYQIDARFRDLGADSSAFPTIVAFNEHAALPHHQPGDAALTAETSVLIDCGACVEGYNSDITRTVWFGDNPSAEFIRIKKIVDDAYQIGCQLLFSEGKTDPLLASDIDKAVRSYIETAGFGQQYIHTTGHGIGIDVHEPPSLYQTNPLPLQEGMVITIEPGIYLPGKIGYRHENTFLLTSQGAEELTQ